MYHMVCLTQCYFQPLPSLVSLKEYGVNKIEYEALLPLMAKQAIDSGSPSNNPRLATVVELVDLYRKVYE